MEPPKIIIIRKKYKVEENKVEKPKQHNIDTINNKKD
jgi:hypothetical protein